MMSVKSKQKTNIMKNIHILPTDKPSRLHYNEFEELVFTPKSEQLDGVNIYITSDEPAYPYAFHLKNQEVFKTRAVGANSLELYHDKGFSYPEECKKIILTTDQDLIKDGVQAIDDEFLEWFVKNPSCERVEVKIDYFKWRDSETAKLDDFLKIIIPKEVFTQTDEKGNPITYWGGLEEPNIIDDWLQKNGDPEIAKQVEQEVKELCEQENLISSYKIKAEKWDKLADKIAKCYVDENGDELSEEDSEDIYLCTIGEIAANAFGWL